MAMAMTPVPVTSPFYFGVTESELCAFVQELTGSMAQVCRVSQSAAWDAKNINRYENARHYEVRLTALFKTRAFV